MEHTGSMYVSIHGTCSACDNVISDSDITLYPITLLDGRPRKEPYGVNWVLLSRKKLCLQPVNTVAVHPQETNTTFSSGPRLWLWYRRETKTDWFFFVEDSPCERNRLSLFIKAVFMGATVLGIITLKLDPVKRSCSCWHSNNPHASFYTEGILFAFGVRSSKPLVSTCCCFEA